MANILLVLSSPRGEASHSGRVARAIVQRLQAAAPQASLRVRDLARQPLPHIDEDFVSGLATAPEARSTAQSAALAASDAVVQEVMEAEVVVLASAMINFGISSTLKTWFDHLLRSGVTFKYTPEGPVGLLSGKKFFVVQARGGIYSDPANQPFDFQAPHIRQMLAFIGVTDVEVVNVEGLALGAEVEQQALSSAMARVERLAA